MKSFSFAAFFALLAVAAADRSGDAIKERLKEFRQTDNVGKEDLVEFLVDRHHRRMEKLAELLEDRKAQMDDHVTGRKLLSTDDHHRVTRQIENYGRKLETLKSANQEHLQDIMGVEADALFQMNSVDYLDFTLNKDE